ncbi:MAG: hypothetical protein A3I32_02395 [Candidatus Yanofskybacteria bacterium RIFCSPLOWO2_02_FULL_45_10]|uniref:Small ribosomal subunit protein uS5 n=2 Tax=Candidatus Yanofskyibacteriota TaxID=1752733 RepID=A0A1F8G122_9BACT|nr:MAG: hypothetical protein A3F25_02895 [Candidatus Yanofskybacteria bacterium RIFCSPHIGHO2_12_FULL_45_19b]OGN32832.1 MAG: hypothetical protein A3I32_02395 [Candidatus Yanofskybacteria bacterium RIFCSPLOWO2_02_FULL_45_10]
MNNTSSNNSTNNPRTGSGGGFGGRGGGGGRRFGGGNRGGAPRAPAEFEQKTLSVDRVSRVTKGGKRFSFRATVVIGDGKGRVGTGMAQSKDVAQSVQKAVHQAKKGMIKVILKDGTILHPVTAKFNSAIVMLKPAPIGSGVKAGGPVRVVAKLGGIENITAKLLSRTNNKVNIAQATIRALSQLRVSMVAPVVVEVVEVPVVNSETAVDSVITNP